MENNSGTIDDFLNGVIGSQINLKIDEDGDIDVVTRDVIDDDGVFVIGAWIESDEQKYMLKKCIRRVRKCSDAKIILATHCSIDRDIVDMVDYHLYDKDNPLLDKKEYTKYDVDQVFFWDKNDIRVERRCPFRHDYAVWSTMKNAFHFADYLGEKNIYYIEYDCFIDPQKFKEEFINRLRDNEVCILDNFGNDKKSYYFNIFSIRTDISLDFINGYTSKEDYWEKNNNFSIEQIFYKNLHKSNRNIYIADYDKNEIDNYCYTHSKRIDQNGFEGYLFPCQANGSIYISAIVERDAPVRTGEVVCFKFRDHEDSHPVLYNNFELFIFEVGSIAELENEEKDDEITISTEKGIVKKISVKEAISRSKDVSLRIRNKTEAIKDVNPLIHEAFNKGMIQVVEEISECYDFLKDKKIKNVLEIGTDKGGTFYLWCDISGYGSKKISLDLPHAEYGTDSYSVQERNDNMISWSDNVSIIEGDSHKEESLNEVKEILKGESVDLLFIDGDHSYEGVKKDYEMYRGLVSDGGFIVFHDIKDTECHRQLDCFVGKFWEELDGEKIEFLNNEVLSCGIGVLKNKIETRNESLGKELVESAPIEHGKSKV